MRLVSLDEQERHHNQVCDNRSLDEGKFYRHLQLNKENFSLLRLETVVTLYTVIRLSIFYFSKRKINPYVYICI